MFSISNKHEEFFDYLVANAQNFHRGAVIANEVMQDVSTISLHLKEIVKLEHESSKTNQDIIFKLSRVFITPIDREDFYKLTCQLENSIDSLQGALMRTSMYHVTSAPEAAVAMTEQLVLMGEEMNNIFELLAACRTLKPPGIRNRPSLPPGNFPLIQRRRKGPAQCHPLERHPGDAGRSIRQRRNPGKYC